ncbi:MAG: PDZ domain-containing protein [Desulfitobacterium sp.]|nr:PDZ domain-containing protein [Desulfitobacterium sp.]
MQRFMFNKFYKNNQSWRFFTALFLAVLLVVITPATVLADSTLDDVRSLIQEVYVEPVSEEILGASSIEEIIKGLGDPYSNHFTIDEYMQFLDSMESRFSGIGVYIELEPRGLEVMSVIKGSPAEEVGLQSGDVIIQVGNKSLAGLSHEESVSLVRGPEGTKVELVVLRQGKSLNFTVERRSISVPTVEGNVQDGIGYISISSFGESTDEAFGKVVKELRQKGAKGWIIDVRNNSGGYLDSALGLAGYFIGNETAVQTKGNSQVFEASKAIKQDILLTEPVVFLTNGYSASASEILAAVVKDYQKGVLVGDNTYGKGSVQSLYILPNNDVLKLTVAKFYSPYGKPIDGVGVKPDFPIMDNDPVKVAQLMLMPYVDPNMSSEAIQFTASGKDWEIPLSQARTPKYWSAYQEFVGNLIDSPWDVFWWEGSNWQVYSKEEKERIWPFFYPGYKEMPELVDIPLNKTFTIKFNGGIDFSTINGQTVELIDQESGQRVPLRYQLVGTQEVRATPIDPLEESKTYWLAINKGIKGRDGSNLAQGALTIVKTRSE